jgi:hypothetical protein
VTGPETIAALAAVLRARAVRVEIESGKLCEDGVVVAYVETGRLRIPAVLDGNGHPVRGCGRAVLQLRGVDIGRAAGRIEKHVRELARQARNAEHGKTFNQAAE